MKRIVVAAAIALTFAMGSYACDEAACSKLEDKLTESLGKVVVEKVQEHEKYRAMLDDGDTCAAVLDHGESAVRTLSEAMKLVYAGQR